MDEGHGVHPDSRTTIGRVFGRRRGEESIVSRENVSLKHWVYKFVLLSLSFLRMSVGVARLLFLGLFMMALSISITRLLTLSTSVSLFLANAAAQTSEYENASNRTIDTSWHAPRSSEINNLTKAINGTGIYGFIFNSSTLPPGVPYGEATAHGFLLFGPQRS